MNHPNSINTIFQRHSTFPPAQSMPTRALHPLHSMSLVYCNHNKIQTIFRFHTLSVNKILLFVLWEFWVVWYHSWRIWFTKQGIPCRCVLGILLWESRKNNKPATDCPRNSKEFRSTIKLYRENTLFLEESVGLCEEPPFLCFKRLTIGSDYRFCGRKVSLRENKHLVTKWIRCNNSSCNTTRRTVARKTLLKE